MKTKQKKTTKNGRETVDRKGGRDENEEGTETKTDEDGWGR